MNETKMKEMRDWRRRKEWRRDTKKRKTASSDIIKHAHFKRDDQTSALMVFFCWHVLTEVMKAAFNRVCVCVCVILTGRRCPRAAGIIWRYHSVSFTLISWAPSTVSCRTPLTFWLSVLWCPDVWRGVHEHFNVEIIDTLLRFLSSFSHSFIPFLCPLSPSSPASDAASQVIMQWLRCKCG